MSNMNTFRIYTLQDSQWNLVHYFTVREFNFPDIPYIFTTYGLFGASGQRSVSDSLLNQQLEQDIDTFQWVHLVAPYTIDYQTTGDPCSIRYQLAFPEKTLALDTLVWIEAVNLTLPVFMAKRWLHYNLGDYQKATQLKIIEELQAGQHEICDPISEFPMRVFLKKD